MGENANIPDCSLPTCGKPGDQGCMGMFCSTCCERVATSCVEVGVKTARCSVHQIHSSQDQSRSTPPQSRDAGKTRRNIEYNPFRSMLFENDPSLTSCPPATTGTRKKSFQSVPKSQDSTSSQKKGQRATETTGTSLASRTGPLIPRNQNRQEGTGEEHVSSIGNAIDALTIPPMVINPKVSPAPQKTEVLLPSSSPTTEPRKAPLGTAPLSTEFANVLSVTDSKQHQMAENLQRSLMLVIWYQNGHEPLRIPILVPTHPFFQLSELPKLIQDLSLTANSYIDAYNPPMGHWEQHQIETIRDVSSDVRLLYRFRPSLMEGLTDCPSLDDEINWLRNSGPKRPSEDEEESISTRKRARQDGGARAKRLQNNLFQ